MAICQRCGEIVPDTAKFCRSCGAPMTAVPAPKVEEDDLDGQTVILADDPVDVDWDKTQVQESADETRPKQPVHEDPPKQEPDRPYQESQPSYQQPQAQPSYQAQPSHQQQAPYGQPQPQPSYQQQAPYEQPQPQPSYQQPQAAPYTPEYQPPSSTPWDHTNEFDPRDAAENKLISMLVYLLGPIGLIIGLLKKGESAFLGFHLRQGMKIAAVEGVILCLSILFIWTVPMGLNWKIKHNLGETGLYSEDALNNILPFSGAAIPDTIPMIIYAVLGIGILFLVLIRVISGFSTGSGKAKEPAGIRSINILK